MSDLTPVPAGTSLRPPPPDELAAAVAAVDAAWPRPVVPAAENPTPAWRFSGRWWARPVTARRLRPWKA